MTVANHHNTKISIRQTSFRKKFKINTWSKQWPFHKRLSPLSIGCSGTCVLRPPFDLVVNEAVLKYRYISREKPAKFNFANSRRRQVKVDYVNKTVPKSLHSFIVDSDGSLTCHRVSWSVWINEAWHHTWRFQSYFKVFFIIFRAAVKGCERADFINLCCYDTLFEALKQRP